MRRRLDLAGALVADPPIIFLDEPTTGLDPRGRTEMWEVIQNLVAGGTTLLLTTQYLEEADLLADDIVVIDHGKIIAQGTADQLKMQVGGERLELTVRDPATLHAARDLLEPLGVGKAGAGRGPPHPAHADHRRRAGAHRGAAASSTTRGSGIDDVGLRRPTLDDVFLSLTGHASEEDDAATGRSRRDAAASRPARGHRRVLHRRCLMAAPTVFSDSYVVAKRNIIKIKRVPDLLVFTTLSPIMFVLLFAYVFGGAIAVPGGTDADAYREFLMAGIFAQTVIFGATITGAGLAEDIKKGIIDRFRSLPMAPSAVLTGRTISDVANNVLVLIVMSLTGLLVGWAHPQLARRGGARLPAAR